MKNIFIIVFLSMFVMSCSTQTFHISNQSTEKSVTKATIDDSDTFYVSGIGQKKSHNPVEICGSVDKIVKVEIQQTGMNILLGMVTFGIYTPRQFRIYCKS